MRSQQSDTYSHDFGLAVRDYLTHLTACGRSSATVESYGSSLRELGSALGDHVRLGAISARRLHAAVTALCRRLARGSQERSQATLNRYRSTFRAFFQWALDTGRVRSNPAAGLCLASVDSAPTPPIRPEETRRFLAAIRRSSDPLRLRDEALFSLYALTGLRRAEALALEGSDYDANERTICVRHGKGRGWRTVPVVSALGAVLDESRRWFPANGGKLFPGRAPGNGLTPRQAHARFQVWKTAARLRPELSIHSFRAGFATAIHEASRDFAMVSCALGHRDFRSTLRYLAPDRNRLVHAIETLARVLCGRK